MKYDDTLESLNEDLQANRRKLEEISFLLHKQRKETTILEEINKRIVQLVCKSLSFLNKFLILLGII
jgi:hypothetical protein